MFVVLLLTYVNPLSLLNSYFVIPDSLSIQDATKLTLLLVTAEDDRLTAGLVVSILVTV